MKNKIEIDPQKIMLKQIEIKDISDQYISWLNDPEINKYLEIRHNVPITKKDVIKFINICNHSCRYHWMILYDEKHVGNISCAIVNKIYNYVNISNLIGEKEYWNSDICKLSLNAAMHYLFNDIKFNKIEAGTYSIHLSGITLLTNLGFKKEGHLTQNVIVNGKYIDTLLFGITMKEWENRQNKLPLISLIKPFWD
jgi:[ribosomal protein S5]-alanine N-acetyltransferase